MDINIKIKKSNQIRAFYLFFIIACIQSGVGIMDAPGFIYPYAQQDVWISIIIAYFYMILIVIVCFSILKQYKNADIFGIQVDIFGNWLGKLLGIIFIVYFFMGILTILLRYIEIVIIFIYPTLSPFAIASLIMFLVVYCILGGIRTIVGVCFLFFLFSQWLLFLLYDSVIKMDFHHLLPVFQASVPEILKSTRKSIYTILGFEILLIVYPFISNKKKAKMPVILALSYTTVVLLVTTIITIGYYSLHAIENINWPVLTLFKAVSYAFIERLDYIVIVEWMMIVLPSLILLTWAVTYGVKRLYRIPQKTTLYVTAVLTILIVSIVRSKHMIDQSLNLVSEIGFWLVFVYPFVLLPLVLIKKRVNKRRDTS